MAQGQRRLSFVENGGCHPRVPHTPPGSYRSPSGLWSKLMAARTREQALKTLQWILTTFKGEGVRFGSGRAYWIPLLGRGLRFALPLRCAGPRVMGPCPPPVGRAHCGHPSILLRARRTGFSHGVGAPTGPRCGAPALRFAPSRCPKPSPRQSLCRAASCVRVHQHIIPDDMSIPSPAILTLSGRGLEWSRPST